MEPTLLAPTPGAAKPGNLYADLQSRTLWLGVDPAVDPNAAVLISDIIALQGEIDQMLAEAKAYTDTRINTRAPTVHTHIASQITDFNAAVVTVVNGIPGFNWVKGMIMQWAGSLAEIGVGGLAGWSLCDGSNGTPDLRDRFILAAGSRAVGAKNPNASFNTANGGTHDHTISATSITVAQLPSHQHGGLTQSEDRDHQHYCNFLTGTETADHTHGMLHRSNGSGYGTNPSYAGDAGAGAINFNTGGRSAAHQHWVQGWTSARNTGHLHAINSEGDGQGHTHTTIGGGGIHNHNITSLDLRESIPFYALAFIMKL